MSILNKADLKIHIDHNIVCVAYGDNESVCIECEDCNEVLYSEEL